MLWELRRFVYVRLVWFLGFVSFGFKCFKSSVNRCTVSSCLLLSLFSQSFVYLRWTNKVGFKRRSLGGVDDTGVFRHTHTHQRTFNSKQNQHMFTWSSSWRITVHHTVSQTQPVFFITQYRFNSWNIWKYNLMHLTHNTFTTYYLPPYWQYNTVQTLNWTIINSKLTSMQWKLMLDLMALWSKIYSFLLAHGNDLYVSTFSLTVCWASRVKRDDPPQNLTWRSMRW